MRKSLFEKLKNFGLVGLAAGSIYFGGGCARVMNSEYWPTDYNGKKVFQYPGELWEKTGEDLSKKAYKVPFDVVGAGLATINDSAEIVTRGITHPLALKTRNTPLGYVTKCLDCLLETTFSATYGSEDMNNSIVGGLGFYLTDKNKDLVERLPVLSFFAQSYVEAANKHGENKLRVLADGTYKNAVKLASLILPCRDNGEAGISIGRKPPEPTNPGPAPF